MRPAHSPYSLRARAPMLLAAAAAWALGNTAPPLHAAQPANPAFAVAQAATPSPAPLFDPAAPTRPLAAAPLAAANTVVEADADWQAANAAVARFARGHADIVRWEKSQADLQPPGQAPAMEHAHPRHPGGQP